MRVHIPRNRGALFRLQDAKIRLMQEAHTSAEDVAVWKESGLYSPSSFSRSLWMHACLVHEESFANARPALSSYGHVAILATKDLPEVTELIIFVQGAVFRNNYGETWMYLNQLDLVWFTYTHMKDHLFMLIHGYCGHSSSYFWQCLTNRFVMSKALVCNWTCLLFEVCPCLRQHVAAPYLWLYLAVDIVSVVIVSTVV